MVSVAPVVVVLCAIFFQQIGRVDGPSGASEEWIK
jgi:hypothetical protein